jgi:8-oxo-dGTP diphosphatase
MSHIHTEEGQYDFTSSAFIVRLDTPEPQLLLHMHKKIGKLLQAGGHVELNENPWEAVLHEIVEETGYGLDQLSVLQPKQIPIVALPDGVVLPVPACTSTHGFDLWPGHLHTDMAYVFVTNSLPKNLPAEGESDELQWFTLKELDNVDESLIVENIRMIGKAALTIFLEEWEAIELPLI